MHSSNFPVMRPRSEHEERLHSFSPHLRPRSNPTASLNQARVTAPKHHRVKAPDLQLPGSPEAPVPPAIKGECPTATSSRIRVKAPNFSTLPISEDVTPVTQPRVGAPDRSCSCSNHDVCSIDNLLSDPALLTIDHSDAISFSDEAIARQVEIIQTIWPTPTAQAKLEAPNFCTTYGSILAYAKPNCIGAKIQVPSSLNLDTWDRLLQQYHDRELCVFLRFGWPVGFHGSSPPTSVEDNHASAVNHLQAVKEFVAKELSHDALIGPFTKPPFQPWNRCSPIMTRPKKDTSERRVIVDFSYPMGLSVNDGINNLAYFGRDISYTLPSIGDLITKLQMEGKGALVWKADLARAYRQLRVDPLDAPLLGIKVGDLYYIDRCPSFGCKTSSAACQRMSNAIVYLMAKADYFLLAYLDDYISCDINIHKAASAYDYFINLAHNLGLQLAQHKCVRPTTRIDWLGYTVDTILMTVAIPQEKLAEVLAECKVWKTKTRASKKMVQSIAGSTITVRG